MQRHSPLETAPQLEELLGSLSLGNAVPNLLVAVHHLSNLHREVVLILYVGADGDSRPDAHGGSRDVRDQEIQRLAQRGLHVEQRDVFVPDLAENLLNF